MAFLRSFFSLMVGIFGGLIGITDRYLSQFDLKLHVFADVFRCSYVCTTGPRGWLHLQPSTLRVHARPRATPSREDVHARPRATPSREEYRTRPELY